MVCIGTLNLSSLNDLYHSRIIDAAVDAKQVHRLYLQTWWANNRTISSTSTVIEGSSLALGLFDRDKQLVAFGRVVSDGIEKATIYDIVVDKNLQSTGLGSEIIRLLINAPLCQKVHHVELYCKEEMIPFYEKFNFADITDQVKLLRLEK